jgi:hypothetical protein
VSFAYVIEQSQLEEGVKKAMIDKERFTPPDLTYWMLMIPNSTWTYDKVRAAIDRWVKERKLVELEPGLKYKPAAKKERS